MVLQLWRPFLNGNPKGMNLDDYGTIYGCQVFGEGLNSIEPTANVLITTGIKKILIKQKRDGTNTNSFIRVNNKSQNTITFELQANALNYNIDIPPYSKKRLSIR
jgi:hypothetical protein